MCVVKNMSLSVSFRDDGIHALPFLRASARASRATANIVVAIVVGEKTSSCFLLLLLLLLSLSLSRGYEAGPGRRILVLYQDKD